MGELMYHTDMSSDQIDAILGGGSTAPRASGRLPELKIVSRRKDADGNDVTQFLGQFYIKNHDVVAYAPEVKIRVLSQLFQWIDFDDEAMKVRNKTIMIPELWKEARDEQGGLRCGKPLAKEMADWTREQKAKYNSINLFRQLRCIVSYEGKDVDGNVHTIENVPCIIMNKRSSYNAFENDVIKKLSGKKFIDYNIDVTTQENEMGSVLYYTWKYKADMSKIIPMDEDVVQTRVHFANMVKEENDRIEASHERNLRGMTYSHNEAALEALEADLDDDLQDE